MDRHVVAIGNFDGVHRGHQWLLHLVMQEAQRLGVRSAVVTFDPLPPEILRPDAASPRLTLTGDRTALIAAEGIQDIELVPFTPELSQLSPDDFVEQLVADLHPVEVVVGEDFRFGHRRAGNIETLRSLGAVNDFAVTAVPRVGDQTADFSSSRIREALLSGNVALAAELLGRPYMLRGLVVEGSHRGRQLGFPTANLQVDPRLAVPADGIYAGFSLTPAGRQLVPSMIYIGSRPTFDDPGRVIEVHLLDFNADLYGAEVTVLFCSRIRGDLHFDDVASLIAQMERDRQATRAALAAPPDWPNEKLLRVLGIEQGVAGGHE